MRNHRLVRCNLLQETQKTITMKNFKEIVSLVLNDSDLLNVLTRHLSLIETVDQNYSHIQDLEVLVGLLKGGLSGYYKEYHPLQEEIVQFCAIIAENTRANHYRKEDKFDDVYFVKKYIQDQRDLKNESELNALENQSVEC